MEPTYTKAQWIAGSLAIVALLAVGIFMVVSALQAMYPLNGSQDCEMLYNEYTSTVDMQQRDVLFSKGIDNGCFHYN